jgi:hypothetical protein
MLRALPDLPPGVLGFEAVGEVHSDDYRDVLRPAIDAAVAAGDGVRLVYLLGPEFTGYSAGADWQDVKLGTHHLSAWERAAVVSDVDWVDHLVGAFAWMVPGELRRFPVAELADAANWAAGIEPEPEPEPIPEPVVVAPVVEPEPVPAPLPAAVEAPAAPAVPEQWAPDPSGRHQHRWWNGTEWTEHVADNGVSGIDPLG